jgi:hypothetical protein
MVVVGSIFLDLTLPNAASWFYFSFLLAHAIFFKFDRLLTLRNWDLFTFYLLVPGLLLVMEAHAGHNKLPPEYRTAQSRPAVTAEHLPEDQEAILVHSDRLLLIGYIWLFAGSAYFFGRCVFDLGLEKRPDLPVNLNLPALAWLGAALFICLTAAAVRRMPDVPQQVGRGPVAVAKVKDGATAVVEMQGETAGWDRTRTTFWVERGVAIALHASVVAALILIGSVHFRDPPIGVGMATLYLMLPYTAYHVSQVHHVWPVAFVLWAVYAYRSPAAAGAWLGVAAGSAFLPFLLFPLWFGFYRGRGAARFALAFAGVSGLTLALTGGLLLLSGELREYLNVTLRLSEWQAWKAPRTEGIWQGSHWAYRLPVFIAYVAFIVLTMFWPTPRHLGQVIAQSAAVVIGVQFWYADQGGVYVLWYLPLVLLMVFRPNLVDVRPPVPPPGARTLAARALGLMNRLRRRQPAPVPA